MGQLQRKCGCLGVVISLSVRPRNSFLFFWQPEKNLFIAGENFCCCDKVAQKYYLNIFLGKNQRQ